MIKGINIYFIGIKNSIAARMAYRADVFFSVIMILISEAILPLITVFIYGTGATFPGWSLYEVLTLQGIFMLSKGISHMLFFGVVWDTLGHVREGSYDVLLLKPCSSLFLSISNSFDINSLGTIVAGAFITLYSTVKTGGITFTSIVLFIFIFLLSISVFFSFTLLMAGTVFVWVGNSRIFEIFDSVSIFGNYPKTIFSKGLQNFLSYIIPISILGFLPASVLLGKPAEGAAISSIVCLVFLISSLFFWNHMVSKYTSAGG